MEARCNAGESGLSAFDLADTLEHAGLKWSDLERLSLADSPNRGSLSLRGEIASLYPNVNPDQVLVTTGTGEALFLAFQLLVKPKDTVTVLWPAFQALYEIPNSLGARIEKIPITGPLHQSMWEGIQANLHIINHPHNPTGQSFAEGELDKTKKYLEQTGSKVLFDEHYRFLPGSGMLGETGVAIQFGFYGTGSFTKCFGVTGLRVGWLVADEKFIERARSFKDYLTHTVSPISERIALGLLTNRNNFLPKIQTRVRNNINLFEKNFQNLPKIKAFSKPMGGLVGWVTLEDGISSETYADKLYEKTGVFVLPGANFECEGFLRIGFGETEKRFAEGLDRWLECSSVL